MSTTQLTGSSWRPRWLNGAIVIAVLLVVLRYGLPIVLPPAFIIGILGGLVCTLLILLWWLFFSRVPWFERLGVIALVVVAIAATLRVVDKSIAGGMMGMMLVFYAIPVVALAIVAGAAISVNAAPARRRMSIVVAILIACGIFTLLRTDGITGETGSQITWRWTPSAEEKLLAQAADEPPPPAAPPAALPPATPKEPVPAPGSEKSALPPATAAPEKAPAPVAVVASREAEWPGFRGRERDGVVHGVQLDTDWSKSPPKELWHRAIGPGWSSFAVRGDLFYTQEQRGNDEIVSCYKMSTGEPVWKHRDPVRFWESNGGAGPRGTPTLDHDRVYALGATGVLNVLDAGTGQVIWSRNAAEDTQTKTPGWGFSSSPLIVGDVVIVATSGTLVGYDIGTGKPRWLGPRRAGSYSSPHLMTVAGVPQVVLLSGTGATAVMPADGKVLWEHEWPGGAIVQPALVGNDVLINAITATGGLGIRRLGVTRSGTGWTVEERWSSTALKPYFNDFVVNKGHAYGFDGSILSCINLEDGKRVWKGGRYGNGQLVLLAEQDLLLVLSEEGELALVSATPDGFKEVSRFTAIEGKTWNHPVLIGDMLLVRNGEEMAAFRMPVAGR